MLKLLHELEGKENRKAQFRTAISLILDGKNYLFERNIKSEVIKMRNGVNQALAMILSFNRKVMTRLLPN